LPRERPTDRAEADYRERRRPHLLEPA
jgi:hypothetical protein